jgi:hypothetical protein
MSDELTTIENLEEAYAQRDSIRLKKADIIKSIIPAEIQSQLDAVEIEFKGILDNVDLAIEELEAKVKEESITSRETIDADSFQVVYTRGGLSVSSKDVQRLADRWEKVNPEFAAELRSILTVKKSSASIRAKG